MDLAHALDTGADDTASDHIDPQFDNNPKVIIKDSPIHGRGVFARIDIPAFSHIGRYEGPVTEDDGMHVLWLYDEDAEQWYGIDGTNEMRFLNHSDQPNAEWSELDLYATCYIEAGQEITFDYGWDEEEPLDASPQAEDHQSLNACESEPGQDEWFDFDNIDANV